MARETQKTARKTAVPDPAKIQAAEIQADRTFLDAGNLADPNGEAMSTAMKSGEAWLAGLGSLGNEMVTFGSTRLKENIDTAESLGRCTTAADVFQVQCDYAHRAAQQYADEVSRIVQMASRIAESALLPLEDRTKETLRGLNGAP